MKDKPPAIIIDEEEVWWCKNCKKYVGLERILQHINPGDYPNAMECDKCDPSHFFYYYQCPVCHCPRLLPKKYYEKFLPLKEGEEVDYCDSCDKTTKVRVNPKYPEAQLCEDCYERPSWEEEEEDNDEECSR